MIFTGLSEIIRKMRKRRGENQAQFAAQIGCKQNTVSQYENGHLEPSPAVLLNLQRLAETEEEKQAFAAWLGADQQPEDEGELDNIIAQIRKAGHMSVIDFAREMRVGQIDVADWESGTDIPRPEHVRRLQKLAAAYKRPDLALVLSSDEWKVRAIVHPGESFISIGKLPVAREGERKENGVHRPAAERRAAHRLLDEIFDSGEDVAIDLVFRQLIVSGNYVRGRRKSRDKEHAG